MFQETPRVEILMIVKMIGRVFAFIPVWSTDIHVVIIVLLHKVIVVTFQC